MYLEKRYKAEDTLHTFDNGTSIQISLILESNWSIHTCISILFTTSTYTKSSFRTSTTGSTVSPIHVLKITLYSFINYNVSSLHTTIFTSVIE